MIKRAVHVSRGTCCWLRPNSCRPALHTADLWGVIAQRWRAGNCNYHRLSPNHTKPDNLMFWSRNVENLDVPGFFYLSEAHEHASCAETKYQVPQVLSVSLLGSECHEYQPHPSCWLVGCAQPTANCQQQHCHDQHVPFITEGQDLTIQDVLVFVDGTSVKVSKWCKLKYLADLAASFLCCANYRSLHLLVQYSLLQWYGMCGGAGWGKAIWCILLGAGLQDLQDCKQKTNVPNTNQYDPMLQRSLRTLALCNLSSDAGWLQHSPGWGQGQLWFCQTTTYVPSLCEQPA